jgi:hypothetical protein
LSALWEHDIRRLDSQLVVRSLGDRQDCLAAVNVGRRGLFGPCPRIHLPEQEAFNTTLQMCTFAPARLTDVSTSCPESHSCIRESGVFVIVLTARSPRGRHLPLFELIFHFSIPRAVFHSNLLEGLFALPGVALYHYYITTVLSAWSCSRRRSRVRSCSSRFDLPGTVYQWSE